MSKREQYKIAHRLARQGMNSGLIDMYMPNGAISLGHLSNMLARTPSAKDLRPLWLMDWRNGRRDRAERKIYHFYHNYFRYSEAF